MKHQLTILELRVREISIEVGIDPDQAMQMQFVEFARTVAMRRAVRESERIALSVIARGGRYATVV